MRRYELMLVIRPDVPDDRSQAIIDRATRQITTAGGQIIKVAPWGRRRLAYPIDRFREGSYHIVLFMAPADALVELERSPHELTIRVRDDGGRPGDARAAVGSGRGLAGLRERVSLFEGSLLVAPAESSGWRWASRPTARSANSSALAARSPARIAVGVETASRRRACG